MFVSVIIAVRNDSKHIKRCLERVLEQSFSDYEIIVVDGQSSDGTGDIVKSLQENHPNITLLNNSYKDAAHGRNIGIKEAKGKIIAFIDSDAYPVNIHWLSAIHKRLTENQDKAIAGIGGPDLPVYTNTLLSKTIARIMYSPLATGGAFNPSAQHKKIKQPLKVKHIPTCNLAIKKTLFDKEGLFCTEFVKGQDLELSTRLAKKGYRFILYPDIPVNHNKKNDIKSFSNQIYKWGIAKALVIKKHKCNIFYTIPILYAVTVLSMFILHFLGFKTLVTAILLTGCYSFTLIFESLRISGLNPKIFILSIYLFIRLHLAYILGFTKGIMAKKGSPELFNQPS